MNIPANPVIPMAAPRIVIFPSLVGTKAYMATIPAAAGTTSKPRIQNDCAAFSQSTRNKTSILLVYI